MNFFNRLLPSILLMGSAFITMSQGSNAVDFDWTLRSIKETPAGELEYRIEQQRWDALKTAIIICDTWDFHHSLNAMRRLEQFAPRMNQVVGEARKRGATIIHAPSDCMPSYATHPARKRAIESPTVSNSPVDVAAWCSKIPAEETAIYPIDQSDGGDDDDPSQHAVWADKLKALGRNPALPWQKQSDLIEIDSQLDFISDRGDEVWNILKHRQIQQVILVGVHTNMCVLGRPFGLRQMARNGMRVVLMRDMTDCMYNPKSWPYVDHFSGNDLVINHVERFVCPTITSDQVLGGSPFRFREDVRTFAGGISFPSRKKPTLTDYAKHWTLVSIPNNWTDMTHGALSAHREVAWYRCAVRIPKGDSTTRCTLVVPCRPNSVAAWFNGQPLVSSPAKDGADQQNFDVPFNTIAADEANLLVLRIDHEKTNALTVSPSLTLAKRQIDLKGRWQIRLGDDATWSNIPLPAKFGMPPDSYFE